MTVTLISSRAVGKRARIFVIMAIGLVCLEQGAASGVEAWTDSRLPAKEGVELWFDCSRQNAGRANMGMPGVTGGVPLAYLIDGSGHGRHLAQHRVDARPKLREETGLSFASFDGTNDVLVGWQLKRKMRETTVFVVASPHSNGGFFRAFLAMTRTGQNDYTTGLNIDLGPGPGAQFGMVNIEGSGAGGVFQMFQGPALPFGGWHILTVQSGIGPKAVRLFFDGKPQAARDRTDSEIYMDEFALGARLYSNQGDPPFTQGFFHGDIGEVIVYGRVLKDAERSAVEHYLSDKYAKLLGRAPMLGDSQPLLTVSNPPPVQVFYPGFTVRQLPLTLRNINDLKYREDGKLVALGYDGQVFLLTDRDGDGLEDHAEPFWTGNSLRAPIGMALTPPGYSRGRGVFVAAKGKVSLVVDTNNDDKADQEIVVAEGWKEIQHGVDALGVAMDKEGAIYFGLGTGNFTDPYLIDKTTGAWRYDLRSERGTIMKVSPDFKRREIVCTGIRFPVGMAFNSEGDLFCTDQEGATWLPNGNPLDELLHIKTGRHYGFPPRHPKHLPNVIDEPSVFDYAPQHQSTCGLNFNLPVNGGPVFGPAGWAGDAFVSGYSRGKIWRTKLVKTVAGYVAKNQLFASLSSLTVDACVSPKGDLVVSTHGGEPDWGSGPNGEGWLYKISYTDKELPQPILASIPAPGEIDLTYDRSLDPATLKDLARRVVITQGKYASAGDRFEVKRPGYAVVFNQLSAPRIDVPVQSASFTPDRRTIVLQTRPLEIAANYAITLSGFERGHQAGLKQYSDIDLVADLTGLQAEWQPGSSGTSNAIQSSWQGWLPHLDLQVAAQFTAGSAEHDALWPKLRSPGVFTLRGQLDLWQMLQPAVQPGASLDYERLIEEITVEFSASIPFKILFGSQVVPSEKAADGRQRAVWKHRGQTDWIPFEISLATFGTAPGLTANWHTSDDPRARAFPMRRFLMPWAKPDTGSGSTEEIQRVPKELAGGNWARGKRLFFGEIATCYKCHAIRGEGNHVGPDLSNLAQRDYASVLKDIRYPSAALNPDHLSYVVELVNGEALTGVLQPGADSETIVIADAAGRKTVSKKDIASMRASTVSLMPEGLDKALGDEQLKDLLTFLLVPPLEPAPIHIPDAPKPRTLTEINPILKSTPAVANADDANRALRILLCSGPKDHGTDEHDYPLFQERWARLLSLADHVTVAVADGWPSAKAVREADVIVFYSNNPGWNDSKALELDEFQRRGGGLVYLHFAVDGHEATQALSERIGLAWRSGKAKFRHGILDLEFPESSPITRGLSHFSIHDESYWQLSGDPASIHVLATSVEEGKPQPVIWTRENGSGRVFVSIPGHYTWTFDDPLFRVLILRGICWAAHTPEDRLTPLAAIGARIIETQAASSNTATWP